MQGLVRVSDDGECHSTFCPPKYESGPLDSFFETEGIAILTMLISQYEVKVKEEPQFASETFEQRQARLLQATSGLTTA